MPITIASIAGASGSGKTTVADRLLAYYQNQKKPVLKISIDNYYRKNPKPGTNFDHPESVELELLQQHLNELLAGKSIEVPTYSFERSEREEAVIPISPSDDTILIVEGIFALNARLTSSVKMVKVYVDTPLDISAVRRLARDVKERGRQLDSAAPYYLNIVRPMYHEHVAPTKESADLVIENSDPKDVERVVQLISRHQNTTMKNIKGCCIDMKVLSGFITVLGIAAVAVAFIALNAATMGTAGVVMACVGATATVLGAIGLFKCLPNINQCSQRPVAMLPLTCT